MTALPDTPIRASSRSGWQLFSPSAQQGLRAVVYLAMQPPDRPVRVSEVAAAEGIPRPFLAKLLHSLRNRGIVRSTKGPGGGFQLARSANDLRVGDVVETFDGVLNLSGHCVLGLEECNDLHPCALHEHWKAFKEEYLRVIASLSIAEAATKLMHRREATDRDA